MTTRALMLFDRRRTLSALVLAVLVSVVAALGHTFITLLMIATVILATFEWRRMVIGENIEDLEELLILILAAVPGIASLVMGSREWYWVTLGIGTLIVLLIDYFRDIDYRWSGSGIIYIGVAVGMFLDLLQKSVVMAVWLIVVVVAMDVGAYYTGRYFKGPKLWPRVSPNKTWAGLCGGTIAALVFGFAMSWSTNMYDMLVVGLLSMGIALISQGGDLAMSAVKRHWGVKDTGAIIPGHGGVLDRIDGHLAAVWAVWVLMVLQPKLVSF